MDSVEAHYLLDIIILSIIMAIGIPVNIYGIYCLWFKTGRLCAWVRHQHTNWTQNRSTIDMLSTGTTTAARLRNRDRAQHQQLSKHLTTTQKHRAMADILIIFILTPAKIYLYLIGEIWTGPRWTCKLYKFTETFGFYLLSNLLLTIAIIRSLGTIRWNHGVLKQYQFRLLIVSAWLFAIACSAPMLFIYDVYPLALFVNGTVPICLANSDITQKGVKHNMTNASTTSIPQNDASESVFETLHLLTLFWIPAVLMLILYVMIMRYIWRLGAAPGIVNGQNRSRNSATPVAMDHIELERMVVDRIPLPQPTQVSRMRHQVLQTSSLLVIVYWLCWLPYNLVAIVTLLFNIKTINALLFTGLGHLILINSALNPLLYRFGNGRTPTNH